MKAITKYKADDGAEFVNEAECVKHEALCAEISTVMAALPAKPKDDGCEFSNGHGFLQHDPQTFLGVRASLLRIGNRIYPHKWFDQSLADPNVDSGWAGRIIGETSAPLERAWRRIECTDKHYREWGQPYYARNPDKGEQVRLNSERTAA